METPSSVKRHSNNNTVPLSKKYDDSGSNSVKSSRRRDANQPKPLIDITNDSPIVGLASGSFFEDTNKRIVATPGSGEALLRGQVKTLLQRVEEEADLSKLTIPPFMRINQHGFVGSSPMGILAPTPANTPQISDLGSIDSGITSVTSSEGVAAVGLIESQKSLNRTLLFDFSDKSDISSEGKSRTAATDDDSSSVWSVQVNASTQDEEDIEEGETEDYYYDHVDDIDNYDELYGEAREELSMDALCDGLSKIDVNGGTKFCGKHSRFVYDSEDSEIAEVITVQEEGDTAADGVLRLKGLPTPKGKHLHFPGEEDD